MPFYRFLCIFFVSGSALAQTVDSSKVSEAVGYHEKGEFNKAIAIYDELLIAYPNATLVLAEKAYSCMAMEDFACCIESAQKVLAQGKSDHTSQAYVSLGSCLDYQGRFEESVKAFKDGIRKDKQNQMLHFNLAVTYVRKGKYIEAEPHFIQSIQINPAHASSHIMLGLLHAQLGNEVQSLLALQYFLLLEQSSTRAKTAAEMVWNFLTAQQAGGRTVTGEKETTINLNPNFLRDNKFEGVGFVIGLQMALTASDAKNGQVETKEDLFAQLSAALYEHLYDAYKPSKKNIWQSLYIPFFGKLTENGHAETFSHYILQSTRPNSASWISRNPDKLKAFSLWISSL